ncbi:IclR family transcriptional regulator [Ottowia caeni]|uniref:IclR family transcriptional regulator n=1 Tax=Ottowia caeni TaxID=2870339 RepID=UPI003D711CEF|nr:helix-turn-helix domain-containing protein [Ottowia caeni]
MSSPAVKSARRAMELLEFFAEVRRPSTIKEISQSLGYPQSSTSVLLRDLTEAGWYDHDERTGMYTPSVRVLLTAEWIGDQLFSEQSLMRLLEGVHRETEHTVMVGMQQGLHVRYLHVLQATRPNRFTAKTGSLRPLFRSATGKMLLTLKTEREVALLLRRVNATEPDPNLVLSLEDVLREREACRSKGYALSLGTSVAGASALAILIPVPRHTKPMTLSIGGPMQEIVQDETRLVGILNASVEVLRKAVLR